VTAHLEISRLSKRYASAGPAEPVVHGFDLSLLRGEFVSLIGHSGCGKSTVLSIVAGLSEPSEGGVLIEGREVRGPGTDRGVVFQAPCLLPWLTALDNVLLGIEQVFPRLARRERRQVAIRYLELVGLGDALRKRPGELSQGMRQRVGIARAFGINPKVLLLDEPFGALDSLTRYELQQALVDVLSRDRKTALLVTHDVDEALFLSDRIAIMTRGPRAHVGAVLQVPFPRPRERAAVIEHPDYYRLRERLLITLEGEAAEPSAMAAAS